MTDELKPKPEQDKEYQRQRRVAEMLKCKQAVTPKAPKPKDKK